MNEIYVYREGASTAFDEIMNCFFFMRYFACTEERHDGRQICSGLTLKGTYRKARRTLREEEKIRRQRREKAERGPLRTRSLEGHWTEHGERVR